MTWVKRWLMRRLDRRAVANGVWAVTGQPVVVRRGRIELTLAQYEALPRWHLRWLCGRHDVIVTLPSYEADEPGE